MADSISGLRSVGEYAEAERVASELLKRLREDGHSKPYEIADAERLLETMKFASALGKEDRTELAIADSMQSVIVGGLDEAAYAHGIELAQKQLRTYERLLGREHPDVAECLNNLAEFYRAQSQYAKAEALYGRALAIRETALGSGHPDVAASLNGLALVCKAQGQYAQAEPLYNRSLAIRERALGPDHPDVAESLNNLAMLYNDQAQHARAELLLKRALVIREKALDPDDPRVATSLNNLAIIYHHQGQYVRAEPLYQRALEITKNRLGPDHPNVATSLNNLAELYRAEGQYSQAEPLFESALAILEKSLGPDHPYLAASLNGLALVYKNEGRYAQAGPLYRRALAISEKALGHDHPHVTTSLNNLAALYVAQGLYAQAEPLHQRALAIREKTLGPDHPSVATSLNNLAMFYHDQGQYSRAEPLYRRALAIREKALGPDQPRVATSLNNLALLYCDRGQYVMAEPLYQRALAIREKALGPDHPRVATSLNNLALLYCDQGQYVMAKPLYRRALAIREKALGREHPGVATILYNLAMLYYNQGQYAQAEPLYQRALAIREKALDPGHPYMAQNLRHLAALRYVQGEYVEATGLLKQASVAFEAARQRVGLGLQRATFQATPYTALAGCDLLVGDNASAWPAVERNQARILADLVMASEQRALSATEVAYQDSLRQVLDRLDSRLSAEDDATMVDIPDTVVEKTRMQLLETQAEWSRFQQQMALKYPVTEGQSFTLERVQAALGEEAAIIGWLDFEVRPDSLISWAYVIRVRGPVSWVRLDTGAAARLVARSLPDTGGATNESGWSRLAADYRAQLVDPASDMDISPSITTAISAARIHPALPMLDGVEHLIVIPSSVMAYIPLESLVDKQGRYLGDRFAISYAPSATIYTWLEERQQIRTAPAGPARTLLVGDPPFCAAQQEAMAQEEAPVLTAALDGTDVAALREARASDVDALARLERLPGTRAEARAIAQVAPAPTLLLGPDASEQELTRLATSGELSVCRVIHLATHAFADPEQPERSCLILSQVDLPDAYEAAVKGERIYDGRLTVQEILREWKLDADLVTLSACETGLGKQISGEGTVGFAHAFLQAGARSLVVSLWKIRDDATSLLMTRFYEDLWRRALPKARALQEAKRWLRDYEDALGGRPYEHPYFWSGFVLVGERD